jgi:hypothetical protein
MSDKTFSHTAEESILKKLLRWFLVFVVIVVVIAFLIFLGDVVRYRYFSNQGSNEQAALEPRAAVMVSPSDGEPSLPAEPVAVGVEEKSNDLEPPEWATPLGEGRIVGYTYPLGMEGPWHQSVPEGGFTIVALGDGTVDGISVSSNKGTWGSIFLLIGTDADGSTPKDLNETIVIDDYVAGHVQVTFIYAGNEDPMEAGLAAVANMFSAPNCGQEGCLGVALYVRYLSGTIWEISSFDAPPN